MTRPAEEVMDETDMTRPMFLRVPSCGGRRAQDAQVAQVARVVCTSLVAGEQSSRKAEQQKSSTRCDEV